MPTKTLLEVVQAVADNINSDEVTSFSEDSVEIDDIRKICLKTLEDLVIRPEWEFLKDRPLQLEAGSTAISLTIPSTVRQLQTVRYRHVSGGVQTGWITLKYMRPDMFMTRLQTGNPTESNRDTVTINSVELYPYNDKPPRYWTTFDEATIVFDSYDSAENPSGIEVADAAILASVYMSFTGSDSESWVAPIPEKLFPLWIQEASADASVKLRQAEDPREERKARRSYVKQLRQEPVTQRDEGTNEVNYGR